MTIPLAPVDISYILNYKMNRRNVDDIPIKKHPSKTLYENIKTFELIKSNKLKIDINKVSGITTLNKFNPQDLGLPK